MTESQMQAALNALPEPELFRGPTSIPGTSEYYCARTVVQLLEAAKGIPSEAQKAAQDDAYVCGRNEDRKLLWEQAHAAGFVEASKILGAEIERLRTGQPYPRTPSGTKSSTK